MIYLQFIYIVHLQCTLYVFILYPQDYTIGVQYCILVCRYVLLYSQEFTLTIIYSLYEAGCYQIKLNNN